MQITIECPLYARVCGKNRFRRSLKIRCLPYLVEHQKPGDPEQRGFITTLTAIAIGLISEIYSASRKNSSDEDTKKTNDAALVRATQKSATATKVIGWFAALTFGAAIVQAAFRARNSAIGKAST